MELIIDAISDTHRNHLEIDSLLSGGNILVHSGDADCSDERTYSTFWKWLIKAGKRYDHVLFVPGNHDTYISEYLDDVRLDAEGTNIQVLIGENAKDTSLRIFGTPVSEAYGDNWTAFAASEFEIEKRVCPIIPIGLDILITHGPAFGYGDAGYGSRSLAKRIQETKPKLHIFGHIHHGEPIERSEHTIHINASICGAPKFGIFGPTRIQHNNQTFIPHKKRTVL